MDGGDSGGDKQREDRWDVWNVLRTLCKSEPGQRERGEGTTLDFYKLAESIEEQAMPLPNRRGANANRPRTGHGRNKLARRKGKHKDREKDKDEKPEDRRRRRRRKRTLKSSSRISVHRKREQVECFFA